MKHLLKPSVLCFGFMALLLGLWGLVFFSLEVRGQGSIRSVAKPATTEGGRRLALVVGNSAYNHAKPLPNPLNDARDISKALGDLGFSVKTLTDANRQAMKQGINDWGRNLKANDIALFYFAGHAVEVNGLNYLCPTDANPQNEAQVEYEAVPVNLVMGWMETAQTLTNIVLLDACRDNPYRSLFKSNAAAGGLGKMDAPAGTFIGFAASPGKPSSDGDRSNGLYTEAILAAITKPNRTIDQIFNEVNANVRRRSNGQQVPFKSSSLEADFYFKVENTPTPPPNEVTPPPITVTPPSGKRIAKFLDLPFADMVYVEGGTFDMGSNEGSGDEKPVHSVTVGSFMMGKYEVTQAQWRAVMGSDPPELYNKNCDDCPVERVSWNDIQEFLKKLNARTGGNYRLPTEAEWEYAARGGKSWRDGYTYAGSNDLKTMGWFDGNYKDSKHGKEGTTHPVGKKLGNQLGIHDMSGNVWEWCSDWYADNWYAQAAAGQPNPENKDFGAKTNRVLRGGSWYYTPINARVANRFHLYPEYRYYSFGFRLVSQSQ